MGERDGCRSREEGGGGDLTTQRWSQHILSTALSKEVETSSCSARTEVECVNGVNTKHDLLLSAGLFSFHSFLCQNQTDIRMKKQCLSPQSKRCFFISHLHDFIYRNRETLPSNTMRLCKVNVSDLDCYLPGRTFSIISPRVGADCSCLVSLRAKNHI